VLASFLHASSSEGSKGTEIGDWSWKQETIIQEQLKRSLLISKLSRVLDSWKRLSFCGSVYRSLGVVEGENIRKRVG
jgi:hypothetical protein